MSGTWATITNAPPAQIATTFLLTDGTVLAQGVSTNHWYKLTPDAHGSYANGTWATMADSAHAPLYYASGILRDGRLITVGGEYDAGAMVWLLNAEIYDPAANTWTTLANPAGWTRVGDAPGCVLPDGRFIVGQVGTRNTAIYDPVANTWTASADKLNAVGEESWSMLPDGTIHAVDCSNPPNAEKYIIASDQWVNAGATPHVLVDGISEIGASVLLPDGRLFVIGATGYTAIYTPPPIANQVGAWVSGPTVPQVNANEPLGAVDAPACLLPNGRVLFSVGPITTPATFKSPTYFFEFDPVANSMTHVAGPATAGGVPYAGRMLMLPTGQVMYTAYSGTVDLYTPGGSPDPVWVPTITSTFLSMRRGWTTTLRGRQLNGLSQCVYYGNDATQATNYPIVRLRSGANVYYCKTSGYSTMGLQTGTIVHSCSVHVPSSVPLGSYCLEVIANGISSACHTVNVTNKWFKELKVEIKEKFEIVENLKEIRDLVVNKRVVEIDVKGPREVEDIFDRIEDEWVKNVRTIAESIDQTNAHFARTFITPDERPELDALPDPVVEEIEVPKASAQDIRLFGDKRAFNDGRAEVSVSAEAERIHDALHAIWKTKGAGFDLGDVKRGATTAKKTVARKAVAEKSVAEQAVDKKAATTRRRQPPPNAG